MTTKPSAHIISTDVVVMLTWGIAAPHAMVGADAAPTPWWHDENQNNFCMRAT